MKEETLIKNCLCCNKELIEGKTIKENWRRPICTDCRNILLSYFMNIDRINRIIRFRSKLLDG